MVVGTLAIGQTIIILTAGVDLSVGAIMVLATVIDGQALGARSGVPGVLALIAGLRCSALAADCSTAGLITRLRLPPFIVTLGTLNIFFALERCTSRGARPIRGTDMDPLLAGQGQDDPDPGRALDLRLDRDARMPTS